MLVPDVIVVKGVKKHKRRTYKLWEEGRTPSVVFEVTSKATRLRDMREKHAFYEELGVQEYFLFDPLDEYLKPRLRGYKLEKNRYVSLLPEEDGTFRSDELHLILKPQGHLLRVVDPEIGTLLPSHGEACERAEAEARRAEAEVQRTKQAAIQLVAQGMSIDEVAALFGLSIEEVQRFS